MKNINLLILLILLPVVVSAQNEHHYTNLVMTEVGDLNNDKLLDSVIVKKDTIAEKMPYRLEVYFGKAGGNKEMILRTENAILPDFPDGRDALSTGLRFWEVEITDDNLWIKHELLRGHFEHRFQFRDGKFRLMEYNYVSSDGRGKLFSENLDLSTGSFKTIVESYSEDKILSQDEEFLQLDSQPDLSNFHPDLSKSYFIGK